MTFKVEEFVSVAAKCGVKSVIFRGLINRILDIVGHGGSVEQCPGGLTAEGCQGETDRLEWRSVIGLTR